MRKLLAGLGPSPTAPEGLHLQPFWKSDPVRLYQVLQQGYAGGGGSVGDFDSWFWPLVEDDEFHPSLMLIAADGDFKPVGLAQCWTSGFLKDLVVLPAYRNRGIGAWLLHQAFAASASFGLSHMDLKVLADNSAAQRFYRRHGMTVVD